MTADKDLFHMVHDHNCKQIYSWAGDILAHAKLYHIPEFQKLTDLRRKIILVSLAKIIAHPALFAEVAKHNYFIVCHPYEADTFRQIAEIIPNIHEISVFALGGENNQVNHVNLDSFYFLSQHDINIMRAKYYTIDQIFKKKQKPYNFLYLNGADRKHRNLMWKKMTSTGLIDTSLSSYMGYGGIHGLHSCDIPFKALDPYYESPYVVPDPARPDIKDAPENYEEFKKNIWQGQWVDGEIIPLQYIDTYFSIVTETSMDRIFITEKTYKPILAGHPFIILGAPGTYRYLKDLGFRTFEPWIDESFDRITDMRRRITMIVEQVKKLCSTDLDAFLEQVQHITQHNHEFYISNREELFYKKHLELNDLIKNTITRATEYFDRNGS